MDTYILEFEFLDLETLDKKDCQYLLDIVKPGHIISGVELPWSNVSKCAYNENTKVLSESLAVDNDNDGNEFSTYLPSSHETAQVVQIPIEQNRIPQPIQISANAPAFVPAAATMASVTSVPPFPNMHQNVQQFPPPFYARPPFPSIPSTYPVTVGPPPGAPNLTNLDIGNSNTGPHYHQEPSHFSPRGTKIEDNHENRHKLKNYTHDRTSSGRRKPGGVLGNKKTYLDTSNMDVSNMVPSLDMYGMNSVLNSEDNVCITMPGQVVDNVVSDQLGGGHNVAHPGMMPISHHTAPFHMPPNAIHVPPGTNSYTFNPNTSVFYPMHFMQFPPSFLHQGGGGGQVVTNVSSMMEGDGMGGHGSAPSHVITGHYEGQPLTMSHPYSSQHHSHSENLMGSMGLSVEEHYSSGQEMCVPRTISHVMYEPPPIPPVVIGETPKDVVVSIERSSEEEENELSDRTSSLVTICETVKDDTSCLYRETELVSLNSVVVEETKREECIVSEVKDVRTKTPDAAFMNSLEDSGVDLGGGESPTLPPHAPATPHAPAPVAPAPVIQSTTVSEKAPVSWGSQKMWSDLFKGEPGEQAHELTSSKQLSDGSKNAAQNGHDSCEDISTDADFVSHKIGKFLQTYQLNFTPESVQPRGLINRSNWCYINATLQALLVCPPFNNLIRDLPIKSVNRSKSATPIMNSLVQLMHEFTPLSVAQKGNKKEDLIIGPAFEPLCMHQMLVLIKSECVKGRQEDAEEFLSCILNGLHEEFLAMSKSLKSVEDKNGECNGVIPEANGHLESCEEESEESDWRLMGPKGKGTVTHCSAQHSRTPITSIFGGQTRSLLNAGSETSATLQPFFTLQLDIQTEGVDSVVDALNHLTVKENIQGYTCPKLKKEVEAFRRMTLEELPLVLIMHFKRFVYDDQDGGSKKVLKKTEYPMELELQKELLSPEVRAKYGAKSLRNYRLFAVVYHDGKEAVKGHYIADVYHAGTGGWLRCDDRKIVPTTEVQVLGYNSPCVPYLLFYGRNDAQCHQHQ